MAISLDPGTYSATHYTSVTETAQSGANLGSLPGSVAYAANGVDFVLADVQTGSVDPDDTDDTGDTGSSGGSGVTGIKACEANGIDPYS